MNNNKNAKNRERFVPHQQSTTPESPKIPEGLTVAKRINGFPIYERKTKPIVDLSKLETLLKAERLTLAAHPEWPPFLGKFIQVYEKDPESALMYFTANAPDGTNARELVASLDLSNIKNEVLTAIYLYLINTKNQRSRGAALSMVSMVEDNQNYDCNNGRNMEVLTENRFSNDLENNGRIINSVFDAYLESEQGVISEYIDSYLETISALKDIPSGLFNSRGWFDEKNYAAENLKSINAILQGKRTSVFKPRITKVPTSSNKK